MGGVYDPALAHHLNAGSTHGMLPAGVQHLAAFAHPHALQAHGGGLLLPAAAAPPPPRQQRGAELYRLKICGVPACTDARLRQLFSLCGTVVEARIVYDRDSGRAAGYAYVSYATKAEADLAIATFDGQVQLAPGGELMSVYYAKRQQGDAGGAGRDGPGRNAKLYFTGMPPGLAREAMLKLFSAHGRVRHLQLYADDGGALTSGTVTMFSRSEAAAAMDALDGIGLGAPLPGLPAPPPLKVAWAQLNVLPKAQQSEVAGATVAYGCVPPGMTPHEVAAVFQRFGPVLKVIPFPARRDGPPGTRGCGRVIMAHPAHVDAAADALSGKFTWPGSEWPMFVQALHDVPPSAAAFAGPGAMPQQPFDAGGGGGAAAWAPYGAAGPPAGAFAAAAACAAPQTAAPGLPPSCEPDAYPLLLSNLPPLVDEAELRALLASYGRVARVELAPLPAGGAAWPGADAGPGSAAVVWYAARAEADLARAALSGQMLRSTGQGSPRQLSVHAGAGGAAAGAGMAAAPALHGPAGAGLAGGAALLAGAGAAHLGNGDWPLSPSGLLVGNGDAAAAAALAAAMRRASSSSGPAADAAQLFGSRPSSAQSWAPAGAPQQPPALQLPRPASATPIPPRSAALSPHAGLGGYAATPAAGSAAGGSAAALGSHLSALSSLAASSAPTPGSGATYSPNRDEALLSSWLSGQAAAVAAGAGAPHAPDSARGAASAGGSRNSSPRSGAASAATGDGLGAAAGRGFGAPGALPDASLLPLPGAPAPHAPVDWRLF
ncbi:hypothetical protein Rsub_01281 [Raphidocelis subcapitata]|uniref:RRM domain-containing protein n=1 Tax=Raphidocelis subcapitata TaxID=307507 RepID=A0A2V0NM67_9CHLO|nr:hypothetical protein Rsub_01281 [Raphidocelis subcapitata]|eukprot:GBF88566.1 hypothetical protein Rsub_01281 [Raphidocelis subcapitata]